jgi:polyhydroxybutyrate depolymerase
VLLRIVLALATSWTAGLTMADAVAAEPSSGCGAPPERSTEAFHVAGLERRAIVVLPEDYRSSRPHALIFAFHGRTNDNVQARRYFGLEEAATGPTIYIYPAALTDRSGRFAWADPGDPPDALRDFAFFDIMLSRFTSTYCIDLDAVFVVGHSLGASFANSLACARAHSIRAVASIAGGIDLTDCSGEVAALLLHNPRDRAVPLSESQRARDVLLGDPGDEDERVRQRIGTFDCHKQGDAETPLFLCLHAQDTTPSGRYYPHQWPEGGTRAIMEFFDILAK